MKQEYRKIFYSESLQEEFENMYENLDMFQDDNADVYGAKNPVKSNTNKSRSNAKLMVIQPNKTRC